jgi:PAS domain S-box-containing protein
MKDDLANARLAAIVGSSDDAIIGKDLSGTITEWNGAAERLFGYTAEEAIGSRITLIAPPEREAEMRDIIAKIARGEKVDHFETQRRHKDGTIIDIAVTVSPIHDATGRVVGASKIAREIGKQKRLLGEKALLAAIVSSSDDAIISKDLNGIITSWNAGAEELFGYSAEEAIGHHISLIAPPERVEEMADILAKIACGEKVVHFETQRRRSDGAIVDISLTVSPIYDEAGRVVGASKIAHDITERRHAEERLRLLMRELDHRAKNVLAVAQAMLRLTHAETVPDYVNALEGRIRALARVHSRVAESRWNGADLRALAAADIDVFSEAGGRMTAEGDAVWVTPAAAQVIAIVLHELSTNAAKHGALSSDSGSVAIRWHRDASGDLNLSWTEDDGPAVVEPSRRGFGTQIIERGIPDQLGGTAETTWSPAGLRCAFVIPAAHIVEPGRRAAKAR